jgi:Na+/proline symporter
MDGTTVFLTAIGYVSFLFLIAWWGGRRFLSGRSQAFVYALSLAVYCTSWTHCGSVGLASQHGLDLLPIYIGPILIVGLGAPFIARIAASAVTVFALLWVRSPELDGTGAPRAESGTFRRSPRRSSGCV